MRFTNLSVTSVTYFYLYNIYKLIRNKQLGKTLIIRTYQADQ